MECKTSDFLTLLAKLIRAQVVVDGTRVLSKFPCDEERVGSLESGRDSQAFESRPAEVL